MRGDDLEGETRRKERERERERERLCVFLKATHFQFRVCVCVCVCVCYLFIFQSLLYLFPFSRKRERVPPAVAWGGTKRRPPTGAGGPIKMRETRLCKYGRIAARAIFEMDPLAKADKAENPVQPVGPSKMRRFCQKTTQENPIKKKPSKTR